MASNKIIREGYVIAQYKTSKGYFTASSSYDRPQWVALEEATVYHSPDMVTEAAKKLWRSGTLTAKVVPLKELAGLELEMPADEDPAALPGEEKQPEMVAAKQGDVTGDETQGVCPDCNCEPCECDGEDTGELSATDHEEGDLDVEPASMEEPGMEEPGMREPGMNDEELANDSLVGQHLEAGAESEEETARLHPAEVGMIRRKRVDRMHPAAMAKMMATGESVTEGAYVRNPTDAEFEHAKKYVTENGGKLGGIGVNKKTGEIYAHDEDDKEYRIPALKEAEFKMPARPGNDPAKPDENDLTIPHVTKEPYKSQETKYEEPATTADKPDTDLYHAVAQEHGDKVTVPAEIKSQLKAVIADFTKAAEDTNMRDDSKGSFALTAAAALQQLLDDLDQGDVSGIKQAQIHMSSYMNMITSYIPADVTKFIAYGGRKPTIRDYFDTKWEKMRGVK